jgi:hypothetical protein
MREQINIREISFVMKQKSEFNKKYHEQMKQWFEKGKRRGPADQ